MNLTDRIKKEMSEGIVRALLEDAGYRVIDSGMEKVFREVSPLTREEYLKLEFPAAMRYLPDLTVFDRDQTQKFLVEIKYREKWDADIFACVEEQVRYLKEIILISINANPPEDKKEYNGPSRYLRSCKIRIHENAYEVEVRESPRSSPKFVDIKDIPTGDRLWWSMLPLQSQFSQIRDKANEHNLINAVNAIKGILKD